MPIYLDNNATTRVASEALDALTAHLRAPGNASSLHRLGAAAARALDEARGQVASALKAAPREVIFTSGGTEANNLAVVGAVRALRRRGDHVVTTAVEHPSVREPIAALEAEGLRVTWVPVGPDGRLEADAVIDAIEDGTLLVSVMHAQNETGAVFPIDEIARRARARSSKLLVHADGVQALGKLPPPGPEVDLYSVSGHKVHGPQGIGALRVGARARLIPRVRGGGQERGLRSGTEPVALAAAFGVAAALAHRERAAFAARAAALGGRLRAGIEELGGVINSPRDALPSTINASFPGVAAEPLLHALEAREVYVSTGSACHGPKKQESPVLRAMGLGPERVASALRFSLSRETTADEVEAALTALAAALAELGRAAVR